MKALWNRLWDWQRDNAKVLTFAGTLIAAGAVVIHFSTFAGMLFNYSDSIGVISAFDNDSAYGIETSEKTWLVNHNGSPMYGPIYYRIGAVYRTFLENDYAPTSMSDSQKRERSVFFHMMLINLIALYVAAFLILWCLTDSRFFQLLGMVVLVSAILRNEWRSQLLFMLKPDHFFAALMTGAGYLTLQWLARAGSSGGGGTKGLALGWAVAASTKLSVIFFGPGLLSLWFPWCGEKARDLLHFVKWLVLFYLLVGFPQNLDVLGYVKYLLQQSAHTRLVSWEFITGDWAKLFWYDFCAPALVLVGMPLWMPLREAAPLLLDRSMYVRFAIYLALSVAFLFSKETHVPHEWYSFPLVNQAWLLLAFLTLEISISVNLRWSWIRRVSVWRRHVLFPFLVLAVLPVAMNVFPRQVAAVVEAGQQCRPEIRQVQERIDALTLAGKRSLVDPYVPADFQISRHLRTLKGSWRMDWAEVDSFRADIIAFRKAYGVTLLADSALPAESRRFYEAVLGEPSTIVDPHGAVWRRTHQDRCGFSIWEK